MLELKGTFHYNKLLIQDGLKLQQRLLQCSHHEDCSNAAPLIIKDYYQIFPVPMGGIGSVPEDLALDYDVDPMNQDGPTDQNHLNTQPDDSGYPLL